MTNTAGFDAKPMVEPAASPNKIFLVDRGIAQESATRGIRNSLQSTPARSDLILDQGRF